MSPFFFSFGLTKSLYKHTQREMPEIIIISDVVACLFNSLRTAESTYNLRVTYGIEKKQRQIPDIFVCNTLRYDEWPRKYQINSLCNLLKWFNFKCVLYTWRRSFFLLLAVGRGREADDEYDPTHQVDDASWTPIGYESAGLPPSPLPPRVQ